MRHSALKRGALLQVPQASQVLLDLLLLSLAERLLRAARGGGDGDLLASVRERPDRAALESVVPNAEQCADGRRDVAEVGARRRAGHLDSAARGGEDPVAAVGGRAPA